MNLAVVDQQQKKDLLFAELDLPVPDKEMWLEKIKAEDDSRWFEDRYHNNFVLPLRNKTGNYGLTNNENFLSGDFQWTPSAFPELITYCENYLFPWTGSQVRLSVLWTGARDWNPPHIDCSPEKMGSLQHKFRMVLQGRSDTLYFMTDQGELRIPYTDRPFLIDGSWLHAMDNDDDREKYTFVLGAPWVESERYPLFQNFLSKVGLKMPADYHKYFDPKYQK